MQGKGNEIGDDKGDGSEENAFAYEFDEDLQTRQTQQPACGHLLRTVGGERHTQVDVVEDGKHQYEQCNDHIELSHVAIAMIEVARHHRTISFVVIEGGERGKGQLLDCVNLIDPEKGLQIVAHISSLAAQVAAFAFHQEQHTTACILQILGIGRGMETAQILNIDHTFMANGNDRAVEVVHHAADGVNDVSIGKVVIAQYHFPTHGIAIWPITLGKRLAHDNLIRCTENLALVSREQTIVEELEEVGWGDEHLGDNFLSIDREIDVIARDGTPVLDLGETVLKPLSDAEV